MVNKAAQQPSAGLCSDLRFQLLGSMPRNTSPILWREGVQLCGNPSEAPGGRTHGIPAGSERVSRCSVPSALGGAVPWPCRPVGVQWVTWLQLTVLTPWPEHLFTFTCLCVSLVRASAQVLSPFSCCLFSEG